MTRTDNKTSHPGPEVIGVAEAKRRFSELIERVSRGERFVIERRGRPALALVPPAEVAEAPGPPTGFAAISGALENWDDIDEFVRDVYATRRRSRGRPVADFGGE